MAQNKPFKFTLQQRNDLLSSWARQSTQDKAWGFIDDVEKIIKWRIVDALPDEKTPHQERDDRENIHALARRLRGALLNQSVRGGHELERFLEREHEAPESSDGGIHPHRERLIAYLETVDTAMTVLTSAQVPRTARKGEIGRLKFMRNLVRSYQQHFGRYPSIAPKGNFRRFLSTLAEILNMPLGETLLVHAIEDVKERLQNAEKIERDFRIIFSGVIPGSE
jgi:hypothetical protein